MGIVHVPIDKVGEERLLLYKFKLYLLGISPQIWLWRWRLDLLQWSDKAKSLTVVETRRPFA